MEWIYAAVMAGTTPIAIFQPWDSEMTYPMFQDQMLITLEDLIEEGFGPLQPYRNCRFSVRRNPLLRAGNRRVIEETELRDLPIITDPRKREMIIKAFQAQIIQAS